MAIARLAVLLFAGQALSSHAAVVSHANLRVQKAETLTFSQAIWNNTLTQFVQHEFVMPEAPDAAPVDKVMYVLVSMFFGLCGIDRCFMGQIGFGICKGLTCGGFIIWAIIDYWVCVYIALTKAPKIQMMGYDATFKQSTIDNAFYFCIGVFVFNMIQSCMSQRQHSNQMQEQGDFDAEFQRQLLLIQQQQKMKMQEAQQQRSVPRAHQALAHVPTPFAKALRKAGVLDKHPSTPELIAAFAKIDKDGDGQLDRDELKDAMSAMGVSDEDVDAMIKEADTDKDGKISKEEFLNYHAKREAEKAAKKAKEAEAAEKAKESEAEAKA